MDVKKLAEEIVHFVGGKENVVSVIHCMTRLRFELSDMKKAQIKEIEELDGVMGVKEVGAQTQVIIGPEVAMVYNEVVKLTGEKNENSSTIEKSHSEQNFSSKVLDIVSGIFAPVVPLITGAGMIKAILMILVLFGLPNTSNEYYILNFIADSGFYFFPVVLAFSSAKKFNCNPYLAAMIGGVLIHPQWIALVTAGEAITFFGIPVKLYSYASSILPTILTVWFMSYVEKFADKVSPKMLKAILKPLITMSVTALVSLIILAPLGAYIGGVLSSGIAFLDKNVPILVPTIVGAIQPFLIFFGMHLAIFPPLQTLQLAEMGYETVTGPGFLAAVLATSGAVIGLGLREKNKQVKELAFSTGFTALCGVTEPAIYGIVVKYKKIIPAVMLGGVSGGLFAGIFHLKRYALAAPGIPALPTFIGEDPNNIFIAIGTVCIAFIVSLVASYILSAAKETTGSLESITAENDTIVTEKNTVYTPVKGTIIPLCEVPDQTFASGVLGQGFAVEPSEDCVYAPFNGTVIQLMDTKHAIGLQSADGVELLIHVGIDTVDMNGNGFELLCNEGDSVNCGQLLMKFDSKIIEQAGHPKITIVVVTNSDDYESIQIDNKKISNGIEKIIVVK